MKRLITILLVVLLLAGAGFGAYRFYQDRLSPEATTSTSFTQTVSATTGSLSSSVTVVGELASEESATLSFEEMNGSAPLVEIMVSAGKTVNAGEVLATIDPAPYQQAVDQAQSAYGAAVEKLADLGAPVTELQTAEADLNIARAELQVRQAQDALDDLLNPDLDALDSRLADARDALAKAQSSLLALQTDDAPGDQLARLQDTESKAAAEHARLVSENYDDAYHQDRVLVAYNNMKNAEDARVSAELQAQVNLLKTQMNVWQAGQNVTKAEKNLAEARTIDPLQKAQVELSLKEAQVALESARDARAELNEGPDATELAAAKADVDKKQLALEDAQTALAGTQLVAPFAGTVLQTNVSTGDTIAANTPILTLANLDQLRVLAAIDETTIQRVQAGQPATITFDAQPGVTLTGAVGEVPLQGSLSGGVMTYEVPIALTGATNLPLLTGMTANVVIATGSVENALLIPSMALTKSNGLYYVRVPNTLDPAAEPETVPVQVGLSDGTYTQIVAGLVEGDQVLVSVSSSSGTTDMRNLRMFMGGGIR